MAITKVQLGSQTIDLEHDGTMTDEEALDLASQQSEVPASRPQSGGLMGPVGTPQTSLPKIGATTSQSAPKLPADTWQGELVQGLLPVAADVIMSLALPEAALMKLASPGFSKIANTVVSKYGPDVLRRLVGSMAGATTAVGTSLYQGEDVGTALGRGGGYAAMSALPTLGAAEAKLGLSAAASPWAETGANLAGGVSGGAAGTTANALLTRGELPSLPEVAVGGLLSGVGETAAGLPQAFYPAQMGPTWVSGFKKTYPEMADIPDALLMDPKSGFRQALESYSRDPIFNPILEGELAKLKDALKDVLRRTLGVVPQAERLGEETLPPVMANMRGALDETVTRNFNVPAPTVPMPAVSPGQIQAQITREITPVRPTIDLPPHVPTNLSRLGVEAREKLGKYRETVNTQAIENFGRMEGNILAAPETPLPAAPFEAAYATSKKLMGEPITFLGNMRVGKAVNALDNAASPLLSRQELADLSARFPELLGAGGEELENLANMNKFTNHQVVQLSKELNKALGFYTTKTARKVIYTWKNALDEAMRTSEMSPDLIKTFVQENKNYGSAMSNIRVMDKALKSAGTNPKTLGRYVTKFKALEDDPTIANTLFSNLEKAGVNPRAVAQNYAVQNLAEKLQTARPDEIAGILDNAARLPGADVARLQTNADQWRAFVSDKSPEAQGLFNILTGKGSAMDAAGGDLAKTDALMTRAVEMGKRLPPVVQEAIGLMNAKNILSQGVVYREIVPGGPKIAHMLPEVVEKIHKGIGGLAFLPKPLRDDIFDFTLRSPAAFSNAQRVAETVGKLYSPKNYTDIANLFHDYYKTGVSPAIFREVRDMLTALPGGRGKQAWEDFVTAQLSSNIFRGTDLDTGRILGMFTDEKGAIIPREFLGIMTEHLPTESKQVLDDLYQAVRRVKDLEIPEPTYTASAIRQAESLGKTAAEAGPKTLIRPLAAGIGGAIGGATTGTLAGGLAGVGITQALATAFGLRPYIFGKALLNNGAWFKRGVTPIIRGLEMAANEVQQGVTKRVRQKDRMETAVGGRR